MKITLDIQSALAQRAGVGRYTRMLAEHLAPMRGDDELALFYFDFKRVGCDFAPEGASQRAIRWIPGRAVQGAWKTAGFPPFDWFAGRADVYHFPNFIRPPLARGRSVVTVHDAAFLRYPDTIEAANYRYLSRRIRTTVDRADAVICVSAFTARELAELLNVPDAKLRVIHSGIASTHTPAGSGAIGAMRERTGLARPYLLTVGTLEPRKNYPFLIDVFERLDFDGDLVIAGMKGWKTGAIFERHAASPARDRIRFIEYVEERDLAALYSAAELFVIPSLYEGFGFPPLESMQCGTPVISSAGGSLPEVLGDAAVIIDGFDPEHWASVIDECLGDRDRLRTLAERGLAQVRRFTWEDAARRTWDLYRELAP